MSHWDREITPRQEPSSDLLIFAGCPGCLMSGCWMSKCWMSRCWMSESLVPVFQGARCPMVPFVPVFDVCEPYSNLITSESVILSLLLLQLPHALLLQLLLTEISIQPNQPTPSLLLIAVFSNSLNKPPLSSTKHKLCYFSHFSVCCQLFTPFAINPH